MWPDPLLQLPVVWNGDLENGMEVFGIEQSELPLVQFNVVIKGGHFLDSLDKAGVANLVANLMTEGTKSKTPQELEEEIEKLGASINMFATDNSIVVSANCLARNYEETLSLVEEMLLEPRWDEEELALPKPKLSTSSFAKKLTPIPWLRIRLSNCYMEMATSIQ